MVDLEDWKQKCKIHEETECYFKQREELHLGSYMTAPSIEAAREINLQTAKQFGGEIEFEGTIRELTVPSIYVEDGIPVTVYRSKNCSLVVAPSIFIYFHGGGNVVGSRKNCETLCKTFSRDSPCVVVNVEYRLAPENRFPADNDDAKFVVRWVMMNKALLGAVNESTVGVGGDSAGGRIAAVVCHEVQHIQYQVLVYPCVDMRRNSMYKSHEDFANFPGLTRELTQWFYDHYIDEQERHTPRASPILYEKFNVLPPALIILAEFDVLKDEGHAYHEKLKEAGIKCTTFTVKGVSHGFFHLPGHFKHCCQRAHEKVCKFIKANS